MPTASPAIPTTRTTPKIKPLAWRNAWEIPEIMAETDAAVKERDTDKRKQMYLDLQKKVQEDGPFVFLFQPTRADGHAHQREGLGSGPDLRRRLLSPDVEGLRRSQ